MVAEWLLSSGVIFCFVCRWLLSGADNILSCLQDIEYRLSGFFKLFQAELGGSAFYAHGAVSLWRRSLLGKEILYKHDTEFHGEDLYMGLLLHRYADRLIECLMC